MTQKYQKLTVQDYLDENGQYQAIEENLDNDIMSLVLDDNVSDSELKYLSEKPESEVDTDEIYSIAASRSELDDSSETAESRYLSQIQLVKDNHNKLKNEEKTLKEAEDEAEGRTHIIFDTLDLLNRPMMAMEGIFQGMLSWNDELYEGMGIFERALEGFNQGIRAEEDEEGRRIINEASLVHALISGNHEHDWSGIESLMIGMPVMFMFGKWDPVMSVFSTLSESKHTAASVFNSLKEKGTFGRLFEDEVFDLNFEDSVHTMLQGAGSLKTSQTRSLWKRFTEKMGLSNVIIKDTSNPHLGEINLSQTTKDLAKAKMDMVNNKTIITDQYLAALKDVDLKIMTAIDNAVNTGDIQTLKEIKAFNFAKEIMGKDVDATVEEIQHLYNFGDGKFDFRKRLAHGVKADMYDKMLKNNKTFITINEIVKDLIDSKKGTQALNIFTSNQILEVYQNMVRSGMWDVETLLKYVEEPLDNFIINAGEKGRYSMALRNATSKRGAAKRRISNMYKQIRQDFEIPEEMMVKVQQKGGAITNLEELRNQTKDWKDLVYKNFNKEMKKEFDTLVKEVNDEITNLEAWDNEVKRERGVLKNIDKAEIDEENKKYYERAVGILKGDITFSQTDDEIAALDTLIEHAEHKIKTEEGFEKKHQAKVDKLSKEIENLELKLGSEASHAYIPEVQKEYTKYKNLLKKKEKLIRDKRANEELSKLTEYLRERQMFFREPKKKIFNFDKNNPDAFVGYLQSDDIKVVLDEVFDGSDEGQRLLDHFLVDVSDFMKETMSDDRYFDIKNVYNGKEVIPSDAANFKKIDKYQKMKNNTKKSYTNSQLETAQEEAERAAQGNLAAKEQLKEIATQFKHSDAERIGDLDVILEQFEKTENKIATQVKKLNELNGKHKMKVSKLTADEKAMFDEMITKIKVKKETLKRMTDRKGAGTLYRDFGANKSKWEDRLKAKKKEREDLVKLKEKEDFDRIGAKERVVTQDADGNPMYTGEYSLAAIKELTPLFESIIHIDNVTDYAQDLGKAGEIIENKVDGYMFSLRRDTEMGKDFADTLDLMTKGKLDETIIDDMSKVPFINNRAFENLGQAIQMGTEGLDYVSPKLANILEQLGGLKDSINNTVFETLFRNLDAGPEMKKAILQALETQQDVFSGEIMDYITDYQKKIAISKIDRYDQSGNIVDETGRAPETNTSNIATGGTSAIKSPTMRGKVSDINEAFGYKRFGADYRKYEMNQQLYLEDPLIAINQQMKDMTALGDMLVTLHHAAESGCILTGNKVPAKLVQQGLYVEVNPEQFTGAISNILKLENENYVKTATKDAVRKRKKKLEQGRPVFQSEDSLVNEIRTNGEETAKNVSKYSTNFFNRQFGDILSATRNDKIYLPKYMFNMLKVDPPKELGTMLQIYDKFMNVWKSWTLLSPGFNFKNFAGNFASQYTVDRKGFSMIGSANKLMDGLEINRQLNTYDEIVKGLQAQAWKENLRTQSEIDAFIKKGIRENVTLTDIAGYSPEDIYVLMKEARNARVLPQSVQDIIGMQTNKGVASVAYTPKDVVEAYKATHRVDAIMESNPIMGSHLQGLGFDLKKPENWAQRILSYNLNLSHEMTNGAKLAETLRLKKLEQEWAAKFMNNKKITDMKFSEFDELVEGLDSKGLKEWKSHVRDRYRQDFGFESRSQMLQDMFFDPGALFGAEKHVLSRLMPFWGFWKKSMQLSLSRLNKLDVQGMYGIERALDYVMRAQDIDYADMSEFSRGSQYLPIKIGDNKLLEVKWGNPTNTLNNLLVRDKNLLAELYSNANPILKFTASEVANREDLFFGGKYDSLLDEAANTLAPGAVRNFWRFLKTQQEQAGYGPDFSDDYKKSAITTMLPSIFKNEVISDNQAAAYNAAALVLEQELNKLRYDELYQIDEELEYPEIPDYQDYIWDFF